MRAMLAAKATLESVKYPVYVSPKLDGIRCLVENGVCYSRKWKPLPNKQLQEWASALPEEDRKSVV